MKTMDKTTAAATYEFGYNRKEAFQMALRIGAGKQKPMHLKAFYKAVLEDSHESPTHPEATDTLLIHKDYFMAINYVTGKVELFHSAKATETGFPKPCASFTLSGKVSWKKAEKTAMQVIKTLTA